MGKYLILERQILDGVQKIYRFENDYGASVVKFPGSYGYEQGKWELAVVKFHGDNIDFFLSYETPITDDVLENLSWKEVEEHLKKIKNLV